MTLRTVRLLALATALPLAAWSQVLPQIPTGGPGAWPGSTMPAAGPSFGGRALSPVPPVSARTPGLSPDSGGGLESEPTWKVTRIERVLLDAAVTRARTRPLNRGSRRSDRGRNSSGASRQTGSACPVQGAEAFEQSPPPIGSVD